MKGKILTMEEAVEVCNALSDEYGVSHVEIYEERDYYGRSCIKVYTAKYRTVKTWFSEKTVTDRTERTSAGTLEEAVIDYEQWLEAAYGRRAELAEEIRQKHATYLLDQELRKEDEQDDQS